MVQQERYRRATPIRALEELLGVPEISDSQLRAVHENVEGRARDICTEQVGTDDALRRPPGFYSPPVDYSSSKTGRWLETWLHLRDVEPSIAHGSGPIAVVGLTVEIDQVALPLIELSPWEITGGGVGLDCAHTGRLVDLKSLLEVVEVFDGERIIF